MSSCEWSVRVHRRSVKAQSFLNFYLHNASRGGSGGPACWPRRVQGTETNHQYIFCKLLPDSVVQQIKGSDDMRDAAVLVWMMLHLNQNTRLQNTRYTLKLL